MNQDLKGLLKVETRTSRIKGGFGGVIKSLGANDILRRESRPHDASQGGKQVLETNGTSKKGERWGH